MLYFGLIDAKVSAFDKKKPCNFAFTFYIVYPSAIKLGSIYHQKSQMNYSILKTLKRKFPSVLLHICNIIKRLSIKTSFLTSRYPHDTHIHIQQHLHRITKLNYEMKLAQSDCLKKSSREKTPNVQATAQCLP